jgi:phage terminase small subunit
MEIVKKTVKIRRKLPGIPPPTVKLSAKARRDRKTIIRLWEQNDTDLLILDRCLQYRDQADRYQAQLDKEGLSIENAKTGASRPHPALSALKLARSNFLTAWRMLDLKEDRAKTKPGRPPASYPTEVD